MPDLACYTHQPEFEMYVPTSQFTLLKLVFLNFKFELALIVFIIVPKPRTKVLHELFFYHC